MKTFFQKIVGITLILGMSLTPLLHAPQASAKDFSDVDETNIYYDAITYLEENGIVDGYPNGEYRPEEEINRAEFTKIVMGVFYSESEMESCENSSFDDIQQGKWFTGPVCLASQNEIINGYPDGTFKPSESINFVEASKIIVNSFEYTPENTENADPWYKPYVEVLGDRNAIPTEITDFDQNITRGQMAEMIYRLMEDIQSRNSQSFDSIESGELVEPDEVQEPTTYDSVPEDKMIRLNSTIVWEINNAEAGGAQVNAATMSGKLYPDHSFEYLITITDYTDVDPSEYYTAIQIRELDAGAALHNMPMQSMRVNWAEDTHTIQGTWTNISDENIDKLINQNLNLLIRTTEHTGYELKSSIINVQTMDYTPETETTLEASQTARANTVAQWKAEGDQYSSVLQFKSTLNEDREIEYEINLITPGMTVDPDEYIQSLRIYLGSEYQSGLPQFSPTGTWIQEDSDVLTLTGVWENVSEENIQAYLNENLYIEINPNVNVIEGSTRGQIKVVQIMN